MNKNFDSPTTNGLKIDFRNYIIELVCLNVNPKLIPRFWKSNKYWAGKYPREIRGFSNLKKAIESTINNNLIGEFSKFDIEEQFVQKILINTIKKLNVRSLSATKTISKIIATFLKMYNAEYNTRIDKIGSNFTDAIEPEKNSKFIDINKKNKLSKLRELENG